MKNLHFVKEKTKNLFKVLYLVTGLLMIIGITVIPLVHAPLAWNVIIVLTAALIIMGLHSRLEYLNLRNKHEYEKEYAVERKTKIVEIRVMQCPTRNSTCKNKCRHERPHLKIKDCEELGCHELANSFYTVK